VCVSVSERESVCVRERAVEGVHSCCTPVCEREREKGGGVVYVCERKRKGGGVKFRALRVRAVEGAGALRS